MSSVQEIYRITEQIIKLVENPVSQENRDRVIELITSLLEEREKSLKDIEKPRTENEKKLAEQILLWNEIILGKFNHLKFQVQQDMILLKKTKATNKQYVNPYQDVSLSDGMFYDKRK
ncbi:flagellar protein FliT [Metabacillus halosaccharovorans]|uniref:flagellar protein FliT n=1 Tax=Metabacillus halosaccharovorans TaxID=930124 RepID=UPI001C1FA659|nr:flagellar protein FliT [Metabacillus halosaccharovorans]MBU7594575.1 flagellar protein FliT [Metabacillus halosaccharovorans]